MKIGRIIKFLCFLAIVVPISSAPQNKHSVSLSSPSGYHTPKYLLAGSLDVVNGDFTYYSINNDTEYAVALTESAKSDTDTKTILSTFNDKPVTGIWRNGFAGSKAATINIPASITVIDYEAFMGSKITSLTIPASVSEIGEGACYSCKSLTKVTIQNSSASSDASSACSCSENIDDESIVRTYSTLAAIPSFCFFNCVSLKELVLPQSIEEIEYEAFYNCISLYSTLAFMNITAIRSRAFQGCRALKKVYISSSFFEKDENQTPIGVIEEKAFENCNDNLEFYLVGDEADVTAWRNLARNAKWNCKNEFLSPGNSDIGSNRYLYHQTPAESGVSYTNDWIFTTSNGNVEITSYIGPTEKDGTLIKFLSVPNELPSGSGNKVRTISTDAFQTVVSHLERLYLPTTLKRIENSMFTSSYLKLAVVDDNTHCTVDEDIDSPTPRIILNGLTELEVIGKNAFDGMTKKDSVKKLYLPYSLKAIGSSAFNNFKGVSDFKWDYDETKSVLEVIGRKAFYRLGSSYKEYIKSNGQENYQLTALIIPRTFKHFGINSTDNTKFSLGGADGNDANFGAEVFDECPLLETVIFRGSKKSFIQSTPNSTDSATQNLVIPTKTFTSNRCLRTIVFEERCGRSIVFHTVGGTYQPAIGWSSGKNLNDFSGDPALQTLVLPNKYTSLYIQDYAFQGNSRGVIYFSGSENNKMFDSTKASCSGCTTSPAGDSTAITDFNAKKWHSIGDEDSTSGGVYPGYWFDSNYNTFGINQQMPVYYQILYKETLSVTGGATIDVEVGTGNTKEYVKKDNCAFVCGTASGKATMTKYLYDRHDSAFSGTAVVPATVDDSNSVHYSVNTIGASAFSATYCDANNYTNYDSYKDLTAVQVPDTIQAIEEYAFMRAYGVQNLYSYDSNGTSNGNYVMPSSLVSVGKHAFAFCNIQQFLKIPVNCLFYENTNENNYVTSVFTNNFSLRKITFGNNLTSSTYYTTTTYTTHDSLNTYTTALYSNSAVAYNKSTLLLVLNRDSEDKACTSTDVSIVPTKLYSQFDGSANSTKYLYGAFKTGYWIESLVVGSSCNEALNQPLISGITDEVYLNNHYDFISESCSLKAITLGNSGTFSVPEYAFAGCESLIEIRLPQIPGGTLPAGLFAYVGSNTKFIVPGNAADTEIKECVAGELDLTYTGYSAIASEAFKNTGITKVIAPITTDFTIEQDAFANCTLNEFNFSNVTGTVHLNSCFRGATVSSTTFNFGNSALIYFGNEAFKGAKFTDNSFIFPAKTALIGKSCFESCNISGKELKTVSAAADLQHLERVVVDSETGKNNEGNTTGFKQIGDYAFHLCTKLDNFDFTNFSQIERIGNHAFSMLSTEQDSALKIDATPVSNTAKICANGDIDLPASITNLGVGAFYGCKGVKNVVINSTTILFERGLTYTNDTYAACSPGTGGYQFRHCSSLLTVFFSEPNCVWRGKYLTKGGLTGPDQSNYFSNCTSMQIICLPTGYELYHYGNATADDKRPDSMCWDSKTTLKFYVYHSLKDKQDGDVINEFWHRVKGGTVCDIVYHANNNLDVAKVVNGKYVLLDSVVQFWTIINDEMVYLGTATVDENTGIVTFSASSGKYKADSTHIYATS